MTQKQGAVMTALTLILKRRHFTSHFNHLQLNVNFKDKKIQEVVCPHSSRRDVVFLGNTKHIF